MTSGNVSLKTGHPQVSTQGMISLTAARQLITENIRPTNATQVLLAEAQEHVLAQSVLADAFYPSGDRSQMDGYVFRDDAAPGEFRVTGEVAAGGEPTGELKTGETFRIFTGALLPKGGSKVVPQEDVRREGELVLVEKFNEKRFVRPKGSEAVPGQSILPQGTLLGATELAILAQVGCARPLVHQLPTVHHVATGGELVDPSETPSPGMIRDTNSSLLRALFASAGIREFSSRRAPDDLDQLIALSDTKADFLILSGGASVGDYDFGAQALKRLGYTIHFDRVNLRPGKPLTFATKGNQAAFVLPGNPVSHFVCFHLAVKLAIELAAGRAPQWPLAWVELGNGLELQQDQRESWWPAQTCVVDGMLIASPKRWSTSGDTFSLAGANSLILVNSTSPHNGRALTLLLDAPAT